MMSLAKKHAVDLSDLLIDIVNSDCCPKLKITGLCIDSRQVKNGDCFVALKGNLTDGANYIKQAIDQGAVAALVDETSDVSIDTANIGIPVLWIKNLSSTVSKIAGRFYSYPSRRTNLVAFTGTNGKTTCSRLYAQLMFDIDNSNQQPRSAFIGTTGYGLIEPQSTQVDNSSQITTVKNTRLTTPDAVSVQRILAELTHLGANHIAMEASSHSLVQHRIADLDIDTAVFTNLSRDHLDYHQDLESYAAAKAKLFAMPSVKTAVINVDDTVGCQIAADLNADIKLLSYSLENTQADVYCTSICMSIEGIDATVVTPWGQGQLRSPLVGEFNLSNLLAVITVACSQGMSLAQCLSVLPRLAAVPGRMQVVSIDHKPKVIVDYAHTPDALEKALLALKPHCSGQLWVIFGCGGDRDTGKRSQMGRVADTYADRVVVTNDNPRNEMPEQIVEHILQGIDGEVTVDLDRASAISNSIKQADDIDLILIAGKGHENCQIVGNQRLPFSDCEQAMRALTNDIARAVSTTVGGVE